MILERLVQRAAKARWVCRERGEQEAPLVEKEMQVTKGSKVAKETAERRDRKDLLEEKAPQVWMDPQELDR